MQPREPATASGRHSARPAPAEADGPDVEVHTGDADDRVSIEPGVPSHVVDDATVATLIDFAELSSRGLDSVDAAAWHERIAERWDDLQTAYAWLLDTDRANDAARIVLALEKYWMAAGKLGEGRAWLERLLAATALQEHVRARALFCLGMLAFWLGDDETVRRAEADSLRLAQRLSDTDLEALVLSAQARLALRDGDLHGAIALCQHGLRLVDQSRYSRGRSSALHVLSVAAQMSGDLSSAREAMLERLELERGQGSLRLVATECSNLSGVERQLGNLERARERAIEALDIEALQHDVWAIPYSLNQLAAVEVGCGAVERAVVLLGAAARLMDEQGAGWPPDEAPVFQASSDAARHELGAASFDEGRARGASMTLEQAIEFARAGLPGD